MRIATVLASFILSACGPGPADFRAPLTGDYAIQRLSENEVEISPDVRGSSTPFIPTKVLECDHDSRFIIAKQQEWPFTDPGHPSGNVEALSSGKFNYWILDVSIPKVFGPYTLEQFQEQRKSLGVPETLALKDIYRFRP